MKKFTNEEKKEYFKNKKEEAKQLISSIDKQIADCSNTEDFKKWLKVMSKFHNYSFNNQMLIAAQCPTATYVKGFRSWQKDCHRTVKKGEKAIKILAPQIHTVKGTKVKKNDDEEDEITYMTYKVIPVFDVSQTEGEELPKICKTLEGDVKNFDNLVKCLVKQTKAEVIFDEESNCKEKGYYNYKDNKIVVHPSSQVQQLKTLVHEITHSLQPDVKEVGETPKLELEAESVAYVVCNSLGYDTSDYSIEYLSSWKQGEEREVKDSLKFISSTANKMIKKLIEAGLC